MVRWDVTPAVEPQGGPPGDPPVVVQEGIVQPGTETAALPTEHPLGADGLPAILGRRDVSLYRRIFRLQEDGEWREADRLIEQLRDRRLMGHVLAQRYLHPTKWRSSYEQLSAWLEHYADHPQAVRIHRLALKRRPADAPMPKEPEVSKAALSGGTPLDPPSYRSSKQRDEAEAAHAKEHVAAIENLIDRGKLDTAARIVDGANSEKLLDRVERDELLAEIAASRFYGGEPEAALAMAAPVAERSGSLVPRAPWIAALAAWRQERFSEAARFFQQVADADLASRWTRAAGAYWASRAHLKLRDPAAMSRWLGRAAEVPQTFYGLLARRALGMRSDLAFASYPLSRARLETLLGSDEGKRGVALLQVGRHDEAIEELLRLGNWDRASIAQGLLALADRANLPALSFKLGERLSQVGAPAALLHSALYPLPKWQPESGFDLDRALVYALVRQESAFDPEARNRSGASGLLQLMPKTAAYIAGEDFGPEIESDAGEKLLDPKLNLALGQKYLKYLMANPMVGGDLFKLAAAYNGGPGNLERWARKMGDEVGGELGDPLLFIECLPSGQTRMFIERVLTNFWIYRQRLGQDTPSLDQIAAGRWPSYKSLDLDSGRAGGHESN